MIESVGVYYDKIEVPVTLHRADGDVPTTAFVYRMRDEMVQRDLESGITHSDDVYVQKCAKSDYFHYELQGLEPPAQISVNVRQAGPSLKSLRTVQFASSLFAPAPVVSQIEDESAASTQAESAAAES